MKFNDRSNCMLKCPKMPCMRSDLKLTLTPHSLLQKYPEVHQYFTLQLGCQEPQYEEKLKFWDNKNIKCFERWTVPYFVEREKDRKRPCLRLNFRPNGKCKDCTADCCIYDSICFMCGLEGHGAFHTHPGGKHQGKFKCNVHRKVIEQLAEIKTIYKLSEDDILSILTPTNSNKNTIKSTSHILNSSPGQTTTVSTISHSTSESIKSSINSNSNSSSQTLPLTNSTSQNSLSTSSTSTTIDKVKIPTATVNAWTTNSPLVKTIDKTTIISTSTSTSSTTTQSEKSNTSTEEISYTDSLNFNIQVEDGNSKVEVISSPLQIFDFELHNDDCSFGETAHMYLQITATNILYENQNGTTIFKSVLDRGNNNKTSSGRLNIATKTTPKIIINDINKLNKELKILKKLSSDSPEVLSRKTYLGYKADSDVWSIGCILYYIATDGKNLFASVDNILLAEENDEYRKLQLNKDNLHINFPIIFDLIERMIRPSATSTKPTVDVPKRISLQDLRCHPFIWNTNIRKKFIKYIAESMSIHTENTSIIAFKNDLNRYSTNYVYATTGWISQIAAEFIPFIYPISYVEDKWWSCEILIQIINNQILYTSPQSKSLHITLYNNLSYNEMIKKYLERILDENFPKFLNLLYELGSWYGKWTWNGVEVTHSWNT
eukprot:gene6001-12094_t